MKTDEELVKMAMRNPVDFAMLYDRFAKRVFGLLATMGLDTHIADDVSQETWIKAWRGLATKPENSPFDRWLMLIAANTARDRLRKKLPVALPENFECAAEGPTNILSDFVDDTELARFRECMVKLPDVERSIFSRRLDGHDSPEIAAELGLPAERVHRLFHNAKQKLQQCLGVQP